MGRAFGHVTWVRAVAVAMGVVAVVGLGACSAGGPEQARPTSSPEGAPPPAMTLPTTPGVDFDRSAPAPVAPGTTPEEATTRFVEAEASGDFTTSFGLLVASERSALGTPARWQAEHRHLPAVRAFEPATSRPLMGGDVEVLGSLHYEPTLDEVLGLVPPTADALWTVRAEDGGWRVAFRESRFLPVYPADTGATAAVEAWAAARQGCDVAGEHRGGLTGSPGLAQRLCGAPGPVQVGAPGPLPTAAASAVVAAFGAEAQAWARALEVSSPVPLTAIAAPVGESWVVVGVFNREGQGRPAGP